MSSLGAVHKGSAGGLVSQWGVGGECVGSEWGVSGE